MLRPHQNDEICIEDINGAFKDLDQDLVLFIESRLKILAPNLNAKVSK